MIEAEVTRIFEENFDALDAGFEIICNEGGSRSGKTYSIIQLLIYIATNNAKTRISIVSHSLPHIKRGAYRDLKLILQSVSRWDEDQWRATDFIYNFKNGSYIELFGLEDEGKARGPGRDILFVNEANLVKKDVFDQLAMRTTGTIFLDWNPAEFTSWVYDLADNPANKKIHSTYLDNIQNLSQAQINYIESYRDLPDKFMWKVYGLGERGASEDLIFPGVQVVDEFPGKGEIIYGLDFGFTNPSAFVQVEIYEGAAYVRQLIYQSRLTKNELYDKVKEHDTGFSPIYADSAEPDSIEEMYRMGFNVHKSNKDVWSGIITMKSMPIFITKDSIDAIREFQSYKWKKDRNGNVLEEPVKENDHIPDAVRYAVHTHLSKPKIDFWTV